MAQPNETIVILKPSFSLENKLIIATIIIVVLLLSAWALLYNLDKKSTPLIQDPYGPDPGKAHSLFLAADQKDKSKKESGYSVASFNEPCSIKPPDGTLANLPEAFEKPRCESPLVCTEGVAQGGPVCLARLGDFCYDLLDCIPEADICLDNVCSLTGETLNIKCETNGDCQYDSNGTRIQNHICVNNRCKANMYPYDSGPVRVDECVPEADIMPSYDSYSGPSFVYHSSNQCLQLEDDYFLLNANRTILLDSIVNLYTSNNNPNQQRAIKSFIGTSLCLKSVGLGDPQDALQDGQKYYILFGGNPPGPNVNVCAESLTEGFPTDTKISSLPIPCRSGLKTYKGYCVQELNNTDVVGNFCLDDDGQTKGLKGIECLYDQSMEREIVANFNYQFNVEEIDRDIVKTGKIGYDDREKGQLCDAFFEGGLSGCQEPAICMNLQGTEQNYCVIPFDTQNCNENSCPPGYTCVGTGCKSNKDSVCLDVNKDCINTSGGRNLSLSMFDEKSNQYKKIIDLSNTILGGDTASDIKLRRSQNSSFYNHSGVSGFFPNYILLWKLDSANQNPCFFSSYELVNGQYTSLVSQGVINFPTNSNFEDLLIDDDGNLMAIYKQQIDTLRLRTFPAIIDNDGNIRTPSKLGILSGQTRVYFTDMNGQVNIGTVQQPDDQYLIKIPFTGPLYELNIGSIGNIPNILEWINQYIPSLIANTEFLIHTYDNVYKLDDYTIDGTNIIDSTLGLSLVSFASSDPNDKNSLFYSGDRVRIKGGTLNIGTSFSNNVVNATLTENDIYYMQVNGIDYKVDTLPTNETTPSTFEIINYNTYTQYFSDITPGYYYSFTKDYYSASGSAPILQGDDGLSRRFPDQRLTESVGGVSLILYDNLVNYRIKTFDKNTSNITIDECPTFLFQPNKNILGQTSGANRYINGLNKSFTFNFEDIDDIKFSLYSKGSDKFMLINKELSYDSNSKEKYISMTQKLKYDIGDNPSSGTSYLSFYDGTSYFNFNYLNNTILPEPPNRMITNTGMSNQTDEVFFVPDTSSTVFSDPTNNQNIITLNNNNQTQKSPPIAYSYSYDKFNISKGTNNNSSSRDQIPTFNYGTDESDLYINMSGKMVLFFSENDNYFYPSEKRIIFQNQDDIELILNNSTAEIVLKFIPSNNENYEVNLAIVDIIRYDVDLDTEVLEVATNVPIQNEQFIIDIITNGNKRFYIRNVVPLMAIKPLIATTANSNNTLVLIQDASLLYTSTKHQGYTEFSNLTYNRTGYNKLLYPNAGLSVAFSNNIQNDLSLYNFYDGFSYKWDNPDGGTSYEGLSTYKDYDTTCIFSKGLTFSSNNDPEIAFGNASLALPLKAKYYYYETQSGSNIAAPLKIGGNNILPQFPGNPTDKFYIIKGLNRSAYYGGTTFNYFYNFPLSDSTDSNKTFSKLFPYVSTDVSKNPSFVSDKGTTRNVYSGTINVNTTQFIASGGNYLGLYVINNLFPLYVANNLFASSINYQDVYLSNSVHSKHLDYVISNLCYNQEGVFTQKIKGEIELYINSSPEYKNDLSVSFYNSKATNIILDFPSNFFERIDKNPNIKPEFMKIFYQVYNNKINNEQFYAIIRHNDQNQLVYFDVQKDLINNTTQQDLSFNDQGVPYSISFSNLDSNEVKSIFPSIQNFVLNTKNANDPSTSNLLAVVNTCKS